MKTISADDPNALSEAMRVLAQGGIVAYPTETFYALGVRYADEFALERLARLKGRAAGKAFPLIAAGPDGLGLVTDVIDEPACRLIDAHWPGPLTILFLASEGLPARISKNGKVAVRMPGGEFALLLAKEAGCPITSTSANTANRPPARTAGEVAGYFPRGVELIIDGGITPGGEASTIVDVTGPEVRIIRQGAVKINVPA